MKLSAFRLFVAAVILIVATSIAFGLSIAGSPGQERLRRLNEQRVQDLISINNAIQQFYGLHGQLPHQLKELTITPNAFLSEPQTLDPSTHQTYEYRRLTTSTHELCAHFDMDSKMTNAIPPPPYPLSADVVDWSHGIGRVCFTASVANVTIQNPGIKYPD